MRIASSLCLALVLASPAAAAQERFKDVWVTQSDSGEVVRGRLVELSGESLAILTPDERRIEMPIGRVLRIEASGDSVKNGAAIGAGVMGTLMVLACSSSAPASQCARAVPFQLTLGALIGAGIDALNGGRSTLYSRPRAPAGKAANVAIRLRF